MIVAYVHAMPPHRQIVLEGIRELEELRPVRNQTGETREPKPATPWAPVDNPGDRCRRPCLASTPAQIRPAGSDVGRTQVDHGWRYRAETCRHRTHVVQSQIPRGIRPKQRPGRVAEEHVWGAKSPSELTTSLCRKPPTVSSMGASNPGLT